MTELTDTTSMEAIAEEFGFSLWQERAPQGPWFLQTPHDGHIFFGGDIESAQQCRDAISRICAQLKHVSPTLILDQLPPLDGGGR